MTSKTPFLFIDSHHHFWSDGHEAPYLLDDYLQDVALVDGRLEASVFIECFSHYDRSLPAHLESTGETRTIANIADAAAKEGSAGVAAAIVAHVELLDGPHLSEALDAHIAAGAGRLRGVRRSVAWDADERFNYPTLKTTPGMMARPEFTDALHMLAERDLHFETFLYHPQLTELATLARACPETRIVANHMASPLGDGRHADHRAVDAEWRSGMALLAKCPNVVMKLGGLISPNSLLEAQRRAAGLDRWTRDRLADAISPMLAFAVDEFGAERCLFESNFPVDKTVCDYDVLVDAYRAALASRPSHEQDEIFRGAARRFYRI